MRHVIALLVLLGMLAFGAYYILWAYQSASFSVAADHSMKAVYETRAMLALPLGFALAVLGVLLFNAIRPRK
jgi:TRAP-type C4-dicarboxylate transport system permease small subunit